jgi:hypothetical protein
MTLCAALIALVALVAAVWIADTGQGHANND